MKQYQPKAIEPKWQKIWEETGIHRAEDKSSKPKRYILEYFPYPSGAAMHVGHVRNYTIGDVVVRFSRMQGENVLHPMGWDAFGLPAENYAIQNKISPRKAIDENTKRFKKQLMQMGFGYDWSREIDSTDPKYYRWTQWLFLLLFKKGLAYQAESLQWWCPVDKTVLANEQVEAGKCWRCGNDVIKKPLKQWFFKITEYADRLADDLDKVDWSESIKTMQRNWIGRSEGLTVEYKLENQSQTIKTFTTAHDTIYGTSFLVLAPEHELVEKVTTAEQKSEVNSYIKQSLSRSEIERQEEDRAKTGVFTGSYALNPINNEKIPIWIADYVLLGYGTGAVMAVPGQDARDYEFAQKYNLPIIFTTDRKKFVNYQTELKKNRKDYKLANSGEFDGLDYELGRQKIQDKLLRLKAAEVTVNYKIRDWLISRQRYWGAPIPIIHCPKDGAVPVPDSDLPVKLPEVKSYEPSGDGRSPLAGISEFVDVKCPKCGGKAQRETDTMDGFACSSWYFLRFADPHNDEAAFKKDKVKYWLPVDDYIGGAEHAVMHLLYARFWTKVMYDAGLIEFDEPFKKLRNHGMILAPDGQKMSKSKNNTIEPDILIDEGYGADAIRLMELFIGPWNQSANWSVEGMAGMHRFLERVWNLVREFKRLESQEIEDIDNPTEIETQLERAVNKTIKKVTQDVKSLSFNTAIAAMMELTNTFYKSKEELPLNAGEQWRSNLETLLILLAPFAPHITEELWHELGNESSIHLQPWLEWDDKYLKAELVTVVVQVNGKVRANLTLPAEVSEAEMVKAAKADTKTQTHLKGGQLVKTITVPGKIVNFVVK